MRVLLNGLPYETGNRPIVPFGIEPLSEPIRDAGLQRRSDFQVYNRIVYSDWSKGVGFARSRRDTGFGIGGLRDSTAETRFPDGIRLSLLSQSATAPSALTANLGLNARQIIEYRGGVYIVGEQRDPAPSADADRIFISAAFDGTTWGTSSAVEVSASVGDGFTFLADTTIHKNRLWTLHSIYDGTNGVASTRVSSNTTSWSDPTNDVAATNMVTSSDPQTTIPRGLILDFDTVLYAFVFDQTNLRIRVFKTADEGATAWTVVTNNFFSNQGPRGKASWYDLQGDPAIVVGTAEGVWALDISASVMQLLFPMPYNPDNCRAMLARGNRLYVSAGTGEFYELEYADTKTIIVRQFGPNVHGGLPAAKTGFATGATAYSPRWWFVAYGGQAASRQASIFAYDFEHDAWHSMLYNGTANQRLQGLGLSDRSDGTMRLHYVAGTITTSFLASPLTDQAYGGALARATTSYVEYPEDDFGDPHETGVLYRVLADASELSASTAGEYMVFLFGRNLTGATAGGYSDNNVGNFVSGTLTLDPSANTTFRTLLLRVELNRDGGTNTDTPVFKELEVRVEKKLDTLVGYVVPIDLVLSSTLGDRNGTQDVLDNLLVAVRSVTLVAFQWGGNAAVNVKVKLITPGMHGFQGASGILTSGGSDFSLGSAIQQGIVHVQVIETLR